MKNKIEIEFEKVKENYPALEISKTASTYNINGDIRFITSVKGEVFDDLYSIEIALSKKYPEELPTIREVGGRIERIIDHHVNKDGTLCVGVIAEVKNELGKHYTLLEYIDKIVVNYLSQYSYKEKYGEWPYGESEHYIEGVLKYYLKEYKLKNYAEVLTFLKELAQFKFRPKGHERCRCGCGRLVKNCSRQKLLKKAYIRNHDYITEIYCTEKFIKGDENV